MKRAAMIGLSALLATAPVYAQTQGQPTISGFGFLSLEVADMARARSFYVDALGMKPIFTISKPGDPAEKIAFNFR